MKHIFIFIMAMFITTTCFANTTKLQADITVYEYLSNQNILHDVLLYYLPTPTVCCDVADSGFDKKNELGDQHWKYFLDKYPFYSLPGRFSFILIDKETGELTEKSSSTPPVDIQYWEIIKHPPIIPDGKKFNFKNKSTIRKQSAVLQSGGNPDNCYAVIISGGANPYDNWIRYSHDCQAVYSMLTDVYGYDDDHIYVLVSDGTSSTNDRRHNDYSTFSSTPLDLNDDGVDDIEYSATKANISTVFNILGNTLDQDDFLFIYSTDHGNPDSGIDVYMDLWNDTYITDDEFATEVDKVNAGEISILMQQCYSGGFIDDLSAKNRVITTSCLFNEGSWARQPDRTYDEFTYHWVCAMAGEDPLGNSIDAEIDNNGYITMYEAYIYACENDEFVDGYDFGGLLGTVYEHPQYSSNNSNLGGNVTLLGKELCITNYTLSNNTIGVDLEIEDCEISVLNIVLQNNCELILDAEESTTIIESFEVPLGCTLEIK
jgi:hypothetical protein